MNRFDIYCQSCGTNIYNSLLDWMFINYYRCPQSIKNWDLIKIAYPRTKFKVVFKNLKIQKVILIDHNFSLKYGQKMKNHVREMLENNGNMVHIIDGTAPGMSVDEITLQSKTFFQDFMFENNEFTINRQVHQTNYFWSAGVKKEKIFIFPKFLTGTIIWYEYNKKDEYYKKANLVRHITHKKNGRNINDYNFCPECAKKLKFKCDLCSQKLKKEKH